MKTFPAHIRPSSPPQANIVGPFGPSHHRGAFKPCCAHAGVFVAVPNLPTGPRLHRNGFLRLEGIQSTAVADTVDATVVVVAEEECSVWHLVQVGRPAPHLAVLQPSFGKGPVFWGLSAKGNHHHAVAHLLGAVPRAFLRTEQAVFVLGREHGAGIEAGADRRYVGPQEKCRRCKLATTMALA